MPSIEINDELYIKLKQLSDFIKQPIEKVVEDFLEKDIEWVKSQPKEIFDYFFDPNQLIKMVFGSE